MSQDASQDTATYQSPTAPVPQGKAPGMAFRRVDEQVELASLVGDVGLVQGTPAVHAHVTVGLSDGSVRGGHLVEAVTFPTVELFPTAFATPLEKRPDPETGLSLFHPEFHPERE